MTKLHLILKSFSARELSTFKQFLKNPLVNQRPDIHLLFEYWRLKRGILDKKDGFKYVFGKQAFNLQKWHLLTSRLFKMVEQFLIQEELKKDEIQQKSLLARAYRNKQIPSRFESAIESSRAQLTKTPVRNIEWLHQKLDIEYEYYDYIASHNRQSRTNLQTVNDQLDEYYIASKLRNACLSISRKTINEELYEIYFLEDVLEKVKAGPHLLESPAIAIYYYCFRAITETESEEWFTNLRRAIGHYSKAFTPAEKRDIILLAINYCIRKLNTGDEYFIREAFELYRLSFLEGYLLEDKILPESTFSNIVRLASKLKEYEWAERFVESNREYLKPAFQKPLYYYSLGLLHYEQGRLEESMQLLAQIDTKLTFILLAVKSLQIKIYYELQELDALDYLLESFRVYLQRRSDLGYRKENFENMVQFVRRLVAIPYKNELEKKRLIEEVKAAKIFSERDWLLRQIERRS